MFASSAATKHFQPRVNLWSTRGQPGFKLGSAWVKMGSSWVQAGVNLHRLTVSWIWSRRLFVSSMIFSDSLRLSSQEGL
jgi:hypothetical protein